jgi:Na+-transporting NADH:ubiquinone oxidoreductase subunit A
MAEKRIKAGFDIKLQGEAIKEISDAPFPKEIAIKPGDFTGIKPKLAVSPGEKVKMGSTLFYHKDDERIRFTSSASGTVKEIIRGEKRSIQAVVVQTDGRNEYAPGAIPGKASSREKIIEALLNAGLFPCFIQRPFAKVASPDDIPRDIFVSAMDTAPLAADPKYNVKDEEDTFQPGLDILTKLTNGKVHLTIDGERKDISPAFKNAKRVEIHKFSGPHPAGNVGVHIHHIAPIGSRRDIVWTCSVQSVLLIGRLFQRAKLSPQIKIAVAGSYAKSRKYYRTILGASAYSCYCLDDMNIDDNRIDYSNTRYISGNVLTGKRIEHNGFVGFYDNLITIIPEREKWKFLGWIMPGLYKTSFFPVFFSKLLGSGFKFIQTTSMNGGKRPFIITGDYEKVLPMDIYPVFLMKSILAEDIDEMEGLGIYELAEEDVALCEYIDPSKNNFQEILRKGLDLIEREG